jgi:hypothetical protein
VKRLKNEPDLAIADARAAVFVERRELGAVQPDSARCGLVEARQQREQRRFAGSRRPYDRGGVAARDAERDGIEDGQLTLGAANLFREIFGS